MATSLIRGRYVICEAGTGESQSRVITDGAVLQRDGVIEAVGTYAELRDRQVDEIVGGPGFLVMPGMTNAHHHGRGVSTFQFGTVDGCLESWIVEGWGRRPVDWHLITLYTAIQMLKSGTTNVMYNHPRTPVSGMVEESEQVLRAFGDAGMRTAYSVYYRGQNRVVYHDDEAFLSSLPADLATAVRGYLGVTDISEDEYFDFYDSFRESHGPESSGGMVSVLLSPSNVQWVSDDFFFRTKELAARFGAAVHMHLVESWYQKEYGVRRWGQTPVAHLADLGFLGSELSCAHSVWLTEGDIELLADSGTTVCHNPSSNLRLKNGIAPVNAMLAGGVNVAMGTDSTALNDDDDMLQEMRLASKLHRQPGLERPFLDAHQALRLTTANAARPTGFDGRIGVLEPGRYADMVLLDWEAMTAPYFEGTGDAAADAVNAVVYRGKSAHVDTVLISGEVVLRGGRSAKVDEDAVAAELREQLSRPIEQETVATRNMAARLLPYIHQFYDDWSIPSDGPHYLYNGRA